VCVQPIQNNIAELWAVLHFLDSATFPSEDDFLAEYGEVAAGSTEHLTLLQSRIAPYFLRRLKEDVEKVNPIASCALPALTEPSSRTFTVSVF
jgi:SNF2 family DNA or RNA helicase